MPDPAPPEPSAARYIVVWGALVVLATVTFLASRVVTGAAAPILAFAIAAAKAGLVVAFFMHLAGGRPVHRLVFAVALGFVGVLLLGVLADVATRSVASAYVDDR
jgi:cytochrome c oxidase subunit 4